MLTTQQIAEKLNAELIGNKDTIITGINPLTDATESDVSFFAPKTQASTRQMLDLAVGRKIGAVLVKSYVPEIKSTQIITPNPLHAIIGLAAAFYKKPPQPSGVHPTAVIHETAELGTNVAVGAYSVIGEHVKIGDNTVIHPHVVVYPYAGIGSGCVLHSFVTIREYTKVGNGCYFQSGAVIGSEGFGYVPDKNVGHKRLPHVGAVHLDDYVDVGANAAIDNGMVGKTIIGAGTKIDNLVQVGHNVRVGKACLMCSQVGVSGSTVIGNDVILAGQVGIADHIHITDGAKIGAQSGITSDITEKQSVFGTPALPAFHWNRIFVIFQKLPELAKRVKELERIIRTKQDFQD